MWRHFLVIDIHFLFIYGAPVESLQDGGVYNGFFVASMIFQVV